MYEYVVESLLGFNTTGLVVLVSFIGGGNRRKPPTGPKSLRNFITLYIISLKMGDIDI
jgi:hypothetical protein